MLFWSRKEDTFCDCLKEYMSHCYGLEDEDRLFPYSKLFLYREMEYGCKASGVKKIRVHDIRHSHASLLIHLKTPIRLVRERLGYENIEAMLRTYAHLYPSIGEETVEKLDDLMR